MDSSLIKPLELLIYSSIVMFIVITVFLVRLLADLTTLSKSLNGLALIVKHEAEPTLREFKKALININSIASTADKQVGVLNQVVSQGMSLFSGSSSGIASKTKIIAASLKQGFMVGLKAFMHKRSK